MRHTGVVNGLASSRPEAYSWGPANPVCNQPEGSYKPSESCWDPGGGMCATIAKDWNADFTTVEGFNTGLQMRSNWTAMPYSPNGRLSIRTTSPINSKLKQPNAGITYNCIPLR